MVIMGMIEVFHRLTLLKRVPNKKLWLRAGTPVTLDDEIPFSKSRVLEHPMFALDLGSGDLPDDVWHDVGVRTASLSILKILHLPLTAGEVGDIRRALL